MDDLLHSTQPNEEFVLAVPSKGVGGSAALLYPFRGGPALANKIPKTMKVTNSRETS